MPTTQVVHYDKLLTNISVGYTNDEYIASQILKEVPVDKQSDRYPVYGEEVFIAHDDRRAPGTDANEIQWTYSDDTYFCEGHALRTRIPDEVKENADDVFDLEADATTLVSEGILLNKEIAASNLLLNSAIYDPQLVVPTGGANQPEKWDDPDSDPIALVSQMKELVHEKIVLDPNTLLLSYPVYNRLRRHPKLIALLKVKELSLIPLEMMKEFFEVDNIIVGRAVAATRTPGGASRKSYIWGNSAILAYVPKNPGKKVPAFGYSFMWNKDGKGAVQVRKWYEDGPQCTFVEAERWYDHKIVSSRAGVLFPDVVS